MIQKIRINLFTCDTWDPSHGQKLVKHRSKPGFLQTNAMPKGCCQLMSHNNLIKCMACRFHFLGGIKWDKCSCGMVHSVDIWCRSWVFLQSWQTFPLNECHVLCFGMKSLPCYLILSKYLDMYVHIRYHTTVIQCHM